MILFINEEEKRRRLILNDDANIAGKLADFSANHALDTLQDPFLAREETYNRHMINKGYLPILKNCAGKEISEVEMTRLSTEINRRVNFSKNEAIKSSKYFFKDVEEKEQTRIVYKNNNIWTDWE